MNAQVGLAKTMCGILATNRGIIDLPHIIEYLKFRGPDSTNQVEVNGVNFVHTLLSMTGPPTAQPFVSEDGTRVAFFNGEIYNYQEFGNFDSDGECLLPAYEKYGQNVVQHLDGEFAVSIIDFKKDILILSTDVFSMKPLWFGKEGTEWGLSSYKSCLDRLGFDSPVQIEANSTYILKLSTLEKLNRLDVYTFDLNQHKDSFDDWEAAFAKSIQKRTQNIKHGIFIGLSSGYDSGAIACELERQGVPFTAYSIVGSEKKETIDARVARTTDPRLIDLKLEEFLAARSYLKERCEEYPLRIDNGEADWLADVVKELEALDNKLELPLKLLNEQLGWYNEKSWFIKCREVQDLRNRRDTLESRVPSLKKTIDYRATGQILTDDNGAIGMSHICARGKREGQLIYLSGSGADEIFSDYGFGGIKHFRHSTIGGLFPEDLELVFPWKNFFDNTQRAYLMKEEHVSGSYGVEGRYPFLDRDVVQEFLWLKPELKNGKYKSVLHHYMAKYDYPFDNAQKVGFNCGFTGGGSEADYNEKKSVHRTVGEAEDESLVVNMDLAISRTESRRNRAVL
jgi:asparagine synthetase B (glutamine-hydrolysing)